MHPKHINVSTAFTGTGLLVIDLNTLIKHIITFFNLNKESLPVFTTIHAFNYIISNLQLTFDDITIVNFEFMHNDSHLHLLCKFLENHVLTNTKIRLITIETYDELQHFVEEERISLCVVSDILQTYFLQSGIYTAILDEIEFRMPSTYMFVYEPFFKAINNHIIKEEIQQKCENILKKYDETHSEMQFDLLENISENERKISEEFVKYLLNQDVMLTNIQIYPENIMNQDNKSYNELCNKNYNNKTLKSDTFLAHDNKSHNELSNNINHKQQNKTLKSNTFLPHDNKSHNELSNNKNHKQQNKTLKSNTFLPHDNKSHNELSNNKNHKQQNKTLKSDTFWTHDNVLSQIKRFISTNNELDLSTYVLNKKKKNYTVKPQKQIFHLQVQAESLYGDSLKVTDINKKEKTELKISNKQKKMIEENQKKIELENLKKETVFLKNLFDRYKNATHEQRKNIIEFETLNVCSTNVKIKTMLLRIEYYYKEWEIEQRKEEVSESVLVPCYLACLELIDIIKNENKNINKVSNKSSSKRSNKENECSNANSNDAISPPKKILYNNLKYENEFDFGIQKLIDCGFESTAHEILENIFNAKIVNEKKNSFNFSIKSNSKPNDKDIYFQMKYAGDKLKRTLHSKYDPRVLFTPDGWQIKLLDMVDANKSAVVCAPTSSGKTFITFYAIEKVLRESDKDIVIFCLPTKALANQVMADVYARFSCKTYKTNKVLQGILMPDFQTNAYNCQVLITVPSMLESLLKTLHNIKNETELNKTGGDCNVIKESYALKNAIKKSMTNEVVPEKVNIMQKIKKELQGEEIKKERTEDLLKKNNFTLDNIKYIIIDEVHKIGSDEMGGCIERVIHLSPSPLLILSATLGNFSLIYDWISKIEKRKGREVGLVMHNERYCEIKPYVYKNNKCEIVDNDASDSNNENVDNNNDMCKNNTSINPQLIPINPLFAFTYQRIKQYGFSNDISFLPEELLDIYYAIFAVLKKDQKYLIQEMRPKKFFKSNVLTKKDIKLYEKYVIDKLTEWIKKEIISDEQLREMYDYIVKDTYEAFKNDDNTINTSTSGSFDSVKFLEDNIIENLVMHLKSQNLLPCIIFNFDRHVCNSLAKKVYEYLEKEEMNENVKKDKKKEKFMKEQKRNRDKEIVNKDNWIEESIFEAQNINLLKNEKKNIKYCFFESLYRKSDYELKETLKDIHQDDPMLVDVIYRGIGVHHNGINKKLRSVVENLFRKKHITVLFSTETLSLGINMPCRTVVFAGDDIKLDIISYKQMAGRAGRRGFDTLGNVIFYGFDKRKIQNLILGGLCNLEGKYGYSNSSLINSSGEVIESMIQDSLYSLTYTKKNEYKTFDKKGMCDNNNDLYTDNHSSCISNKDTANNCNDLVCNYSSTINNNNTDGNNDNKGMNNNHTTSGNINTIGNNIISSNNNKGRIFGILDENTYNLGNFFMQTYKRRMLIDLQIKNIITNYYKFDLRRIEDCNDNFTLMQHLPNTVFSDFILSNKNHDPITFVFLSLFYVIVENDTKENLENNEDVKKSCIRKYMNLLNCENKNSDCFTPLQWMHLFAHFFGVRYTKDVKYSLKPLDSTISDIIDKVNDKYIQNLCLLQTNELNYLQSKTSKPMFKIPSFFYVDDHKILKNSFLVDFFENSNIHKIRERNKIDTGELFAALVDVCLIAENLIKVLQDKSCVKGLKVFYDMLQEKISKIAA